MGQRPSATEELFALRQAVARIEGKPDHAARLAAMAAGAQDERAHTATGMAGSDAASVFAPLATELTARGAMVELRGERLQQAGAVTGLGLSLALMPASPAEVGEAADNRSAPRHLLFIADPHVVREAGRAYAPGLTDYGLAPAQLVHALPRRIEDALWLTEAALSSRAFAAVLLEVHGNPKKFGLTESRRLSLKARGTGGRLLILRQAGEEEASSAALRLSVEPAPAVARSLADGSLLGGSIGNPVFRIRVEKSRMPGRTDLILEWTPHDRRLRAIASHPTSGLGSPYSVPLASEAVDGSHRPPPLGSVLAFGPVLDHAS
ncbi:ImuA family protein [Rhizobium sp. G187]|uniref:ImuA family protein n=1 Tax=Rhizobium sp. G187 TaxID=3451352 RepID=UPI003EE56095